MTKKRLQEGRLFTLYVERQMIAHVKRIARNLSTECEREVSCCEVIRLALEQSCPLNGQITISPEKGTKKIEQLTFNLGV